MRIDEWVRRVEASLPPSWCASWDNAGLLVARRGGELARVAVDEAVGAELAEPNQRVIILAGFPMGSPGAANILRIAHAPRR